jgi:hypothetical protein
MASVTVGPEPVANGNEPVTHADAHGNEPVTHADAHGNGTSRPGDNGSAGGAHGHGRHPTNRTGGS